MEQFIGNNPVEKNTKILQPGRKETLKTGYDPSIKDKMAQRWWLRNFSFLYASQKKPKQNKTSQKKDKKEGQGVVPTAYS